MESLWDACPVGPDFAKIIRAMRFLRKLTMKLALLATMMVLMGGALKQNWRSIMRAAGVPEGAFSSDESGLMKTVLESAFRLFSGSASRNELANDLSDKIYAGRPGADNMAELGVEIVKPGASPSSAPEGGPSAAKPPPDRRLLAKQRALAASEPPAERLSSNPLLIELWEQAKAHPVELALVPVLLIAVLVMHRIRRRSQDESSVAPPMAILTPGETEPFDMTHAVHTLKAEDFELLVALIYQRQGYRVSMPAGLGGGRGGDFTIARKSERVLVQCKRLSPEHKVPVERVRELHEAATAAGATRGMYVASCNFTWDARNFAKTKKVTLINARTLDGLIAAALEKPGEDLLAVSQWVPKFMSKVELTPPLCPACEATMDQLNVNGGAVWVCSQRPDCRGRRSARNYHKPARPVCKTVMPANTVHA
jgi:hypothetical protein